MSASWMDSDWSYRAVASLNRTATSGAADATVTMLLQHQHLWDNVDTNGEDIRATGPDGASLLTFDLLSFNSTTQTGTLEIQSYAGADSAHQIFYVYYGATGKSTGVTSFVASGVAGSMTGEQPSAPVLRLFGERPGDPNPRVVVSKHPAATVLYTIPLPEANLSEMLTAYQGRRGYEGWSYFTFTVSESGTPNAALVDETLVRVLSQDATGERLAVRVAVTGGTNGTNYMGTLTLTSTLGRIEVLTFEIRARTPVETS